MKTPVTDLISQLKESYTVKSITDLSEISLHPGALLNLLEPLWQSVYEPNDRIVFYTANTIPEGLLKHLYETANFLDISNYFILICATDDSRQLISDTCQKYSADPCPFQFLSINLEPTKTLSNKFFIPDTVCAVPWASLQIENSGNISSCCLISGSAGHIVDTTLDQAFYGKTISNLRQQFLNGEKPAACNSCWKVEDQGLTSIRNHNTKRLKKKFLTELIDRPTITSLDIKFNNTCNFKCRICGPSSSSLFALEEHQHKNIPLVPQYKWSESDQFLDQIVKLLPQLTNIDMYGGEPFLIKKFSTILKAAVEKDYAKNIRLHYNSNGSIWPDLFLPYWAKFKLVDIHFSIDAVGKQFELQRGGKWTDVEKNILSLKDLDLPNLNISIMPTVTIMNVYYLDDVYRWATQHGFQLFANPARSKKGFELSSLTYSAKQLLIEKFKNHPWQEIQKILKIIDQIPDSDGKLFCESVKWFDSVRNENFANSHPEIATAMGYVYNKNI
jgi:MoaA/NifB/PqqE/SkfB family radical SAM enzyme